MKKQELNKWKVATILLGIVAICLLVNVSYPADSEVVIDGVRAKQSNLDAFKDNMVKGQQAKICNLEDDICTIITKIND